MVIEDVDGYDNGAWDDFNDRDFALYPRSRFRQNFRVEDESVELFVEFIELLRDIPYVIFTIIMIPFMWRFQSLIRELWNTRTNEACCTCDDIDDDAQHDNDNDHDRDHNDGKRSSNCNGESKRENKSNGYHETKNGINAVLLNYVAI
jgi:hypothetical protein